MKEFETLAVVAPDPTANASQLLVDRVAQDPHGVLFALPLDNGGWRDMTTHEFHSEVVALAKGFMQAGIKAGDKVGFMCKTRYEWTLVDFGLWFAGAVMVPIYETSSPSQVHYTLEDSGAVALIVENAEHFQRFDEIAGDVPHVTQIWQMHLGDLDKLAASGPSVTDQELEKRRSTAKGSDLATLIYTSGSTGQPKGCMLTHSNFVELIRNSAVAMKEVVGPGSTSLLFITTAHIFARFISVMAIHTGTRIGHQADTSQLLPSLGSFKPTFLLAVPRVFEKVYNSAEQKAEAGGKGKIFRLAADTAIEYSQALDTGVVPFALKLKFRVFETLVYSKLKKAMGGNVAYAVSGSAPLSTRLGHFYRTLGIKILEGYGLTETTAPATENLVTKFKIGTCGPPLPGVAIRTDDDGEVQVKGINVFDGYWNNPEATKAAFTEDGWFRTGDIGSIDDDGYLSITGRKKEIIVTAGGKNVAPNYLEDPIRANPLVGQVVVVGDNKPFIAALVTLDPEMLPTWLANNGVTEKLTLEQACEHASVRAEVQRAIDGANSRVSRAESIRKFVILPTEFTEASGHLTPKMSIKRAEILRDFDAEMVALYSDPTETQGISVNS
ncbi:AMP-dependent synthetase/ligase [Pontimonas sp.]|nr:AMP-dependent synthetase/ligase [Pontimonas sp.]MDB4607127.1 AMP-dependent synthetase/ligase [Pontimonas sp.]